MEETQMAGLHHKLGDKLDVLENGSWLPCVLISIASYAGKSGPGYYAAYDPPRDNCASFWCYDRVLRRRIPAEI